MQPTSRDESNTPWLCLSFNQETDPVTEKMCRSSQWQSRLGLFCCCFFYWFKASLHIDISSFYWLVLAGGDEKLFCTMCTLSFLIPCRTTSSCWWMMQLWLITSLLWESELSSRDSEQSTECERHHPTTEAESWDVLSCFQHSLQSNVICVAQNLKSTMSQPALESVRSRTTSVQRLET